MNWAGKFRPRELAVVVIIGAFGPNWAVDGVEDALTKPLGSIVNLVQNRP